MEQMQLDLDRPEVAEAKDKIRQMAEEHRAKVAAERRPNKDFGHTRVGGIGGYGGADLESGMKGSRMPKPKMKAGGKVSSASKRADGCAIKGKTKGRML